MIRIEAELGGGTFVLRVHGHEEASDSQEGRVCAAVSAITQTALLGLDEIARQYPQSVNIDITEE